MNKYQEAINILSADYTGSINNEALDTLQELVEKTTPKKALYSFGEYWCDECTSHIKFYDNYCWGCGQRIDWSEKR